MSDEKTMTLLTKAAILQGRDAVHREFIKALGGEVALSPLTGGQWAQIEAVRSRGGTIRVLKPVMAADGNLDVEASELDVVIDLEKSVEADAEADALAAMYALGGGGEHWTLEEVKSLRPAGVVRDIAVRVYDISGVQSRQNKQVQRFRRKQ